MFSIEDIKILCNNGKIKWSEHSSKRMLERGIFRDDVLNCLKYGEIIEEYPNYWLNPAALVFGYTLNGKVIHTVVGIDAYLHIITAYFPDRRKFEADMKTRKENKQ